MPAKKAPLQEVKDRFESKEKLVDELVTLLKPAKADKDVLRERLRTQANSKLLRLHAQLTEINETFGGKEKLVDEILAMMGHAKDTDRREKMLSYSAGRLLDLHRRHKKASKAA